MYVSITLLSLAMHLTYHCLTYLKALSFPMNETILEKWQLTAEELTEIIDENPSLRGFMLGYVAEYKLRLLLTSSDEVSELQKPDDHARGHGKKNDMTIVYKGHRFSFEVKSLQTNSITMLDDGTYIGKAQVDASDSREVILPNGDSLKTTCLVVGGFDILGINLFQFREEWDFGFILNRDLPRSRYRKYTPEQQEYLLSTLVSVTWPLQNPFMPDPFALLDVLVEERGGAISASGTS